MSQTCRRVSLRWLLLGLALASAWLAWAQPPAPALAQTSAVVADRYDVDITVQPDGALAVVERLALDFAGGPFRHGFSTISLARVEAIRDVQVGEPGRRYERGEERPYTYTASRSGDVLRIDWWFPPTTNTRREFEISYRAEGVVRIYPDGDQLYWQAVDADRGYLVREASALVHLPADVGGDGLRAAAYPERQRVAIQQEGPRTMAFRTSDLRAGMGLVVRVQFPHGLVAAQPPSWQAEADRADWLAQNLRPALNFLLLLVGLLLPVAGLVGLGVYWVTRGRDPGVQRGAPLLESPPSDLPAPLAGTLLDERADAQDAVATVVDLANRGVLRITEAQDPTLVGSSHDYQLERLTTDDAGLRDYERRLLTALFGEGQEVRLSQVRRVFASAIPVIQAALHQEVVRAGLFYEDPEAVRQRYRRLGWVLIAAAIIGGIFLGGWLLAYADLAFVPFLGLLVLGGLVLWLSGRMPRRTRAGALAADRWGAFRRYLEQLAPERSVAERDKFEGYLPYAIAFGLDRSWIERFASVGTPAPSWYGGGSPVVILGGPGWGGGWGGWGGGWGGYGGDWTGQGPHDQRGAASPGDVGSAPFPAPGYGGPGGLQGTSDSLMDMLNRASDVFASGGGSGWSGGGNTWSGGDSGGGWSGGGAGDFGGYSGASGGGSSGFDSGGGGGGD